MENNNVQYYLISKNDEYDSNKFNYSLENIYLEDFKNQIKDEQIYNTLLKIDQEKNEDEKLKLLHDLSLLENVSDIKQQIYNVL